MKRDEISIATITWARDAAEEALLRSSMQCLAGKEMSIVVTDGGSSPALTKFLQQFSSINLLEADRPNVWGQTRQSLTSALNQNSRFILYTESDKQMFFEKQLDEFIAQAPDDESIGIVLPSRSPESFSTYPSSQQYTETVMNRLCAEIIGIDADYCYGPLLINRLLISHLDLIRDDAGWGWRFFLFGLANRLGYRLIKWEAELPCPLGQREDSRKELLHRMRQLSQNIQGLVQSVSVPDSELEELRTGPVER